jgi:hypothetical protein
VLGPDDQMLGAWGEWKRSSGGIDSADRQSLRLMPLMYRRLADVGHSDPDLPRLGGLYRHAWYHNQRLLHSAAKVVRLQEEAGISTLLLKGAALLLSSFGDVGVRPMGDIDVLVPWAAARRALQVLEGHRWTPKLPGHTERMLVTRHAQSLFDPDGQEIDLHWHAFLLPAADEELWASAVPTVIGGTTTRILCPSDQLLHVVAHGTAHFGAPMMWVVDAVTVSRRNEGEIDWDRIVDGARARGIALRVGQALEYLAAHFEVVVPERQWQRLRDAPTSAAERWSHWALAHETRHGSAYLHHWERWQRVKRFPYEPQLMPGGFLEYIQWHWQLESRRELGRRLLRKALQIALRGRSDPTGKRTPPTRSP